MEFKWKKGKRSKKDWTLDVNKILTFENKIFKCELVERVSFKDTPITSVRIDLFFDGEICNLKDELWHYEIEEVRKDVEIILNDFIGFVLKNK